jgi:hypothetical protein
MSDCCPTPSATGNRPKRRACPRNGVQYRQVSAMTIRHHIKNSWKWQPVDQGYFFCKDPECPVVYFGEDDTTIEGSELRTEVGVKAKSEEALICYCFGISISQAKSDPNLRDYVVRETKLHQCACEARNPSGKCCLSDFPKT